MLSAFTPTHYFSDIYTHLGVMLYNPSSYPGRNICASLAWWSGSRGHRNETGIVTANVCTTQSYQAVLTSFHSGMSLKTEKYACPGHHPLAHTKRVSCIQGTMSLNEG